MRIGGDYGVFPYRNTWLGAAHDLGLDPDELVNRVRELGALAPDAFADAAKAHDVDEMHRPLPGKLVDLVVDRSARCRKLTDGP